MDGIGNNKCGGGIGRRMGVSGDGNTDKNVMVLFPRVQFPITSAVHGACEVQILIRI